MDTHTYNGCLIFLDVLHLITLKTRKQSCDVFKRPCSEVQSENNTICRFTDIAAPPLAGLNRLLERNADVSYRMVKDSEGSFSQTARLHTRTSSPGRRALVRPAAPIPMRICSSTPRPTWCLRSAHTHTGRTTAKPSG